MSGHSKWATTKRKKAKTDVARAKAWNKLIKEISIAAKLGGGNPDANPRLRAAILKSKSQSLPTKNIESVQSLVLFFCLQFQLVLLFSYKQNIHLLCSIGIIQ